MTEIITAHDYKHTKKLMLMEVNMYSVKAKSQAGNKKNNFMAPFYGWGSTASRLEPLRGGSLLFTTKFLDILSTHIYESKI